LKSTPGKLGFLVVGFLFLNCAAFRPKPIFVSGSTHKSPEKPTTVQGKSSPKSTQKSTRQKTVTAKVPVSGEKSRSVPSREFEPTSLRFRQQIMRAIDDYLGTPYKWGGENVRGMDCSGFVKVVFQQVSGLNLPHSVEKLAREGKPVLLPDLQFGDLIFFRKSGSGQLFHVGIYLGSGNFAHASTQNGVTISSLSETYYKRRAAFGRRLMY